MTEKDHCVNDIVAIPRSELEEMAAIPCCHVSGMHDPEHFVDGKGPCSIQLVEAFKQFCTRLGINPVMRSKEGCSWCDSKREEGGEVKGDGMRLFRNE